MTSARQIAASRLNARKSTGPRTERGRRESRKNALRHGLTAEIVTGIREESAEYLALEVALLADRKPRPGLERELILRLASLFWRLAPARSRRAFCKSSERFCARV